MRQRPEVVELLGEMNMVAKTQNGAGAKKKELRKFGVTLGIVFCLLACLFLWRDKSFYPYFFIPAAPLLLLGIVRPTALGLAHQAWMGLAICLGWVVTRVILFVLFFLVVTPIAVIARLFGRASLNLRFDRKQERYWIHRTDPLPGKDAYEKQY